MSQLIIEHDFDGRWRQKYKDFQYKDYSTVKLPSELKCKSRVLGSVTDNRELWRKKLDSLTKNADYEIAVKSKPQPPEVSDDV